jgi:hypothetical protein
MTDPIVIKVGVTGRPIRFDVPSDGPATSDISTVTFEMYERQSGIKVLDTDEVTIEDVDNVVVQHEWLASEVSRRGVYDAQWVFRLNDGSTLIYPEQGYIEVQIVGLGDREDLAEGLIVTPSEVGGYLRRRLTETEYALATWLIEFLQNQVEVYLGRPVTVRKFTETVFVNVDGAVYLRNTPVQQLVSVADAREPSTVFLDGYELRPWGMEVDQDFWVNPLIVTYDAGLNSPGVVKGLIVESAAARLSSLTSEYQNVRRISVEDFALTFDRTDLGKTISIPEIELASLKRLKRRGFA